MKVEIYGSAESHTVRGATVNFNADSAAPVTEFVAEVNPNGFDGRTGVDINNNGTTKSVAFGKTCYGGSANVTTGTLTEEYGGGAYDPQNVPAEVKSEVESKLTLETATPGDIVSFDCELGEYPLAALSFPLAPIQDLHGYDSPWPSGGGKNKYDSATVDEGQLNTNNGGIATNANWQVSDYIPMISGNVTLSWDSSTNFYQANICAYDSDKTFISGSGVATSEYSYSHTFTAPEGTAFVRFSWSVVVSGNPYPRTNVRVNIGSSDLGYSPYSNICPIYGHTDADVTRMGKNLNPWEGVDFSADTHPSGVWLNAGDYVFSLDTGSAFGAGNNIYIKLKDRDGNVITEGNISGDGWLLNGTRKYYYGFGGNYTSAPFTLLTDCFFCFGFNNTKPTANGVQLELGSTASAYSPYVGTTYPLTWQSEAGTVYGGNATYLGGGNWRLTSTMVNIASYNGEIINEPWLSSMDSYVAGATPTTGAQVVYPLATPQTYTITTEELTTLLGQNNVWCDAGEISELKYYDGDIADTDIQTENGVFVTGDKLFYALSSPRTSSFTPTAVNTVQGENTMSANTGDIAVTYTTNWHDITPWIAWQGLSFSRNDVDGPNAGRDMAGYMHRGRVASKEKMNVNTIPLTRAQSAKLQTLLFPETILVRVTPYPRTNAAQIFNMYCNNVKTSFVIHRKSGEDLQTVSFPLIEN